MVRTHLKNTSARDMSQFPQDQETTTKVYPLDTPRRSDAGIAEIGSYPMRVAANIWFRGVATASQ
ncbi:MAG: hypothetical protein HYW56_00095 [Candidatus Harrisonbacteria bacterium]|nr:hypothetical protein [Candidatus Harrisonbacteria bacterium]